MLSRNRSANTFTKSSESHQRVNTSLNQKDKIISMLRSQLQSYNTLYENFSKTKDKKSHLLDKCDHICGEMIRTKQLYEKRQNNDGEKLTELSIVVKSLERQLKQKNLYLRDLRMEANKLMFENENKSNDFEGCCGDIESKKTNMNLIMIQRDRMQTQIDFLKEQIKKLQSYQQKSLCSIQKIRNQGLENQTYIRNLSFEEKKTSQQIEMTQTENEKAQRILEQLNTLEQLNKNKIREKSQQNSNLELDLKRIEIQKGRIDTKKSNTLARIRAEEQKQRQLFEKIQKKKSQLNNISNILKNQVKPQILELQNHNQQSHQINAQLKSDFQYCDGHLQNILRLNKILTDQLDKMQKTTNSVVKLLTSTNNNRKNRKINNQVYNSKRQGLRQSQGINSREPLNELSNEQLDRHTYRSQSRGLKKSDYEFYDTADQLNKTKNSRIL